MMNGGLKFAVLGLLVLFGMGLYAGAGVVLGAFSRRELTAVFRR